MKEFPSTHTISSYLQRNFRHLHQAFQCFLERAIETEDLRGSRNWASLQRRADPGLILLKTFLDLRVSSCFNFLIDVGDYCDVGTEERNAKHTVLCFLN